METTEDKSFVYEFGKFVLDPNEKTLFLNGSPLRLTAKEFETLLLLVENNHKALSKDEMMSTIWQDSFVEESNLAKQISRLRKILNTNGEQFIETLPKHGYRFSADLRRAVQTVDESVILEKRKIRKMTLAFEQDEPKLLSPKPGLSKKSLAAITAIIIGLVVGAFAWFSYERWFDADAKIDSIAVLPLRTLSTEENDKILALGLTDLLITKLAGLRQIVVRPFGAVAAYSDGQHDSIEVGRRLSVDAVLEGTILQSDGRLRINLRLLKIDNGEQIWADKFDGEFTNVFDVEDRMSEQAARALTARLTGEPGERLTKRFTEVPEAFNSYLKGRYFWSKRTEKDLLSALEQFAKAIAADPNYALAYAGAADCYNLLSVWGAMPATEAMPKAKDYASKAIALDDTLAESHTSLAFAVWVYDWDREAAEAEFKRALALTPNYSSGHHWYAYFLASQKRFDEAISHIKKAQEIEPLSLSIGTDVGEIYLWAGRYDEAVEELDKTIHLEPNYAMARNIRGITYLKQGKTDAAVAELETAAMLDGSRRVLLALGHAYAVAGQREKALSVIRKLHDAAGGESASAFSIAVVYAGLGDNDSAIAWLQKAKEQRSDTMAIVGVYPLLDGLASDQRFKDLVSSMKLEP